MGWIETTEKTAERAASRKQPGPAQLWHADGRGKSCFYPQDTCNFWRMSLAKRARIDHGGKKKP